MHSGRQITSTQDNWKDFLFFFLAVSLCCHGLCLGRLNMRLIYLPTECAGMKLISISYMVLDKSANKSYKKNKNNNLNMLKFPLMHAVTKL